MTSIRTYFHDINACTVVGCVHTLPQLRYGEGLYFSMMMMVMMVIIMMMMMAQGR